jgi:Leucine-rich repeat (LRR) protein
VKPNPLENGMRVYADGGPFIGNGGILEGMRVYANGEDMSPALIYHTSTSATWTATLKGPAGSFVTFDWGDGSTPTTLELATGGTAFIHDYSGAGAGTKVIRMYGDLRNISSLDAHNRNIDIISSLNILINLNYLRLDSNNISDISSLSGLTNLNYLRLNSNDVSDISLLSGLTSLTTLNLEGNDVSDISPLSGLTSLSTLYLDSNNISDISLLSGLTSLTTLYLNSNDVSDISPLSGLTSLTFLLLNSNDVSDISPLSGLTSLTTLNLNNNDVSDISLLSGLTSLTTLNLYGNNIDYPLTGISWFTATSGTFRFDSTVDSSAEVDRWLNDLAAANWSNCVIYLGGTNPARTSASDAAIATLLVNGCTVYVNE